MPATCTTPATCKTCGVTNGEALGHTWIEADCDNPRTCSVCGETEGIALGHSTDFGKCSKCGAFQGVDTALGILTTLNNACDKMSFAVDTSTSGSDQYTSLCRAASTFASIKSQFQDAYNKCGNCTELALLKQNIMQLIDALPVSVSGRSDDQLIDFLEQMKEAIYIEGLLNFEMLHVGDMLKGK